MKNIVKGYKSLLIMEIGINAENNKLAIENTKEAVEVIKKALNKHYPINIIKSEVILEYES